MFGQVGFFNRFAGKDYEDKRPRDRYVAESKRLLGVLERRLADRTWIMGNTDPPKPKISFAALRPPMPSRRR